MTSSSAAAAPAKRSWARTIVRRAGESRQQNLVRREAAYERRWGINSKPHGSNLSEEEKFRAKFWRYANAPAKCYSCSKNHESRPEGDNVVKGHHDKDLLPCGCKYEQSVLEMWLSHQKLPDGTLVLAKKKEGPSSDPATLGLHRATMLRTFELFFGEWTFEKMTSLRERANAATLFADDWDEANPLDEEDDEE